MKKLVSMLAVMALCLMLLPQAALADDAGTHTHCVCGATHAAVGDHTTADAQTFTAWESDSTLPDEAGYYYLTNDVTLTNVWSPKNGTVLCLNGHNIIMDNKINIEETCTFTLTDCNSGDAQGKITHAEGKKDHTVYVDKGTFNMYGGVISDNTASDGAVYVYEGTFNMYDGVIADNVSKGNDDNYTDGGGVYVVRGQFNMSGGKITGNTAQKGGGVYLSGGTFNMSGGEITENTAKENGGGVNFDSGTFNMSGGKITGNTAVSSGGAVYIAGNLLSENNAYFTMSGGEISGNTAKEGGGVFLADRSEAKMSGGKITGNTANRGGGVCSNSSPIKVGGTIYVDGNKFNNGFANNIFTQKRITVDTEELGELAEGACLSLVYESFGVKVEGVSQSDANYFKMDDKAYELKWQDDNTLYAQNSSSYVVVNGVEVLESNQDVLNDGGSVKYDDDTKTLTLTNASLTKDFSYADNSGVTFVGIYTKMDKLNIELVGDNSITLPNRPNDSYSKGICIYNELNITGNGSLTVQAGNVQEEAVGIEAIQLTIGDDVTLTANGGDVCGGTSARSMGIHVGRLTIGKAKVTATGGDIVALNNGKSTGIDISWEVPMEIADGAEVTATGGDVTVETGEKLTAYTGWAQAESNGIRGGNITIGKADVKATSGQAIMLNSLNTESYAESYAVYCYGLKIDNGGNLTANGGVATCVDPDDSTKIGKYVQGCSCACYIQGVLDVSGTLIATGGDVVANGELMLDDEEELTAWGGSAQSMAVYVTNGTSSLGGVTVREGAKVKLVGANATSKSEGIGKVYSYGLYLSYTNFTMNGGTVYVKSGTVTGGEYRGTIAVSVNGYENNYYGDNGGKFTMNGGWLKAETSNDTALSAQVCITLGDDVLINTPANGKISDQNWDSVYIVDGQGYVADTVLLWDGTTAAYTEPGSNNGGGGGGGHSKKDNTAKEEEKNETRTDEVVGETEFTDVKDGDYFGPAVKWATGKEITGGTTATTFGPYEACTRAQVVTFLWRVAGSPTVDSEIAFTDVDSAAYYAEAIRWAASKGIVDGYGDGTFGPNDTVTREQVAAILYRFAKAEGMDTTQGGMQIREFADYESISEYAIAAMQWAVNAGIMQGYDNYLTPADECIRAQIVTMLYRLLGE